MANKHHHYWWENHLDWAWRWFDPEGIYYSPTLSMSDAPLNDVREHWQWEDQFCSVWWWFDADRNPCLNQQNSDTKRTESISRAENSYEVDDKPSRFQDVFVKERYDQWCSVDGWNDEWGRLGGGYGEVKMATSSPVPREIPSALSVKSKHYYPGMELHHSEPPDWLDGHSNGKHHELGQEEEEYEYFDDYNDQYYNQYYDHHKYEELVNTDWHQHYRSLQSLGSKNMCDPKLQERLDEKSSAPDNNSEPNNNHEMANGNLSAADKYEVKGERERNYKVKGETNYEVKGERERNSEASVVATRQDVAAEVVQKEDKGTKPNSKKKKKRRTKKKNVQKTKGKTETVNNSNNPSCQCYHNQISSEKQAFIDWFYKEADNFVRNRSYRAGLLQYHADLYAKGLPNAYEQFHYEDVMLSKTEQEFWNKYYPYVIH